MSITHGAAPLWAQDSLMFLMVLTQHSSSADQARQVEKVSMRVGQEGLSDHRAVKPYHLPASGGDDFNRL